MLGSVDVVGPDGAVDLHGRKPRALVASLVVHRPDARTSAQLMDDLWPAGAPPAASGALQAYISRLRRLLGASAMQRTSAGYRLDCDVDADRFVASLTEASRATTPERAAQRLRRGLMLWRGVPFGDVGDEDFARVEAVRLWELRGDALEDLFQAELAGGRCPAHVVAEIESAVATYPFREQLWFHLMLALYREDRRGEALKAYGRAQRLLGEELGIEPGASLQALELRILQRDPELITAGAGTTSWGSGEPCLVR